MTVSVEVRRLAERYLEALEAGDLHALLALFGTDGVVVSPLYGTLPAREFYARLLDDTTASRLRLHAVTEGRHAVTDRPVATIHFEYEWQLRGGDVARFDVVDVLELTSEGEIGTLTIVYDTHDTRAVIAAAGGA